MNHFRGIALNIFQFLRYNNTKLIVTHNKEPNEISQVVDFNDWETSEERFKLVTLKWDPFTNDSLASSQNNKLDKFYSKFSCPTFRHAFCFSWENENVFLVPPVNCIIQIVDMIKHKKLRVYY